MDILAALDAKGIDYETTTEGVAIVCPSSDLHAGGVDSHPSFRINVEKEVGYCFVCNFALNESGMHSWLVGEDLDDLQHTALIIKSTLRRLTENGESPLIEGEQEVFFPRGEPWSIDGYRGISLETYQLLGAVKVTNGRYQNRIAFPITLNGEVIGVDARTLGDDQPKYLRNKGSSCRHDWLYPYDVVKEMKPKLVLLGEGIFHSIAGINAGYPALCFFGANNFSDNKVMMLLNLNVEEVCFFPDPDKTGYQTAMRVCSALAGWFKVTVADMSEFEGTKTDLGDLSKEQIEEKIRTRYVPALPGCLRVDWKHKIEYGAKCREKRCRFWSYGKCANELFMSEV